MFVKSFHKIKGPEVVLFVGIMFLLWVSVDRNEIETRESPSDHDSVIFSPY